MTKTINSSALLALTILLMACSSNTYLSQTATNEFRTDGQRSEWTGRFQIPEGESFALGLSNDKNYLYLAISSIDQDFQRQLAMGGLTLWLDSKGGKRQDLGIRFDGVSPQNKRSGRSQRRQPQFDDPQDEDARNVRLKLFDGDLTLIVLDTKAGKSLGPADLLGSVNSSDGTLFIEYQIPLVMLGDKLDMEKLGLGLESTIERPSRTDGRPDGMNMGASGGRSGGMGGGQRGGQRGNGQHPNRAAGSSMDQNDLDMWMKVQLTP